MCLVRHHLDSFRLGNVHALDGPERHEASLQGTLGDSGGQAADEEADDWRRGMVDVGIGVGDR